MVTVASAHRRSATAASIRPAATGRSRTFAARPGSMPITVNWVTSSGPGSALGGSGAVRCTSGLTEATPGTAATSSATAAGKDWL